MFYHLRSFRMLWIWNFDQCAPFTNKVDFITSILNFLDPWNIGFWSVKFSKLTRHGNWSHELLLFIKVHLRWKVQVPHFLKSVHIWSFSVFCCTCLNTEIYRAKLHIQSEYRKIWIRKIPNTGTFYIVLSICR